MARRPSRRLIADLVDQWDPRFRDAFMAAIDDVRANADLAAIVKALEAGDIPAAIRAIHLTPAAFDEYDQALGEAFRTAGQQTIASFPVQETPQGGRLVIRFDMRNVRAETWLRQHSSEFVTAIIEDQREAIRKALEEGMAAGLNPRTVALDIIGRMNNKTGKREGGLIGLTAQQEQFVANARAQLLSGDKEQLRSYLQRSLRDRRFDAIVARAIAEEKPVAVADASRMLQRYKDRLLKLRGDTIGRTEAMASLHAAQFEALEQTVESGAITRAQAKRRWRTAGDRRVRHTHEAMEGQTVAVDKPFKSPSGALLRYPGDPQAPPGEIINCRCWAEPAVDFLAGIR